MPGQRRLNLMEYESPVEQKIYMDPSMIPNIVPQATLDLWTNGDESPYFKLQKIAYPVKANGLVYKRSFFESFLNKLTDHPIPGAKGGHALTNVERSPTDFILVGGKIEGDVEKGFVYLKTYIPPRGDSGDNSTFIAENKSGMVHYSIVTYPKEQVEKLDDGSRQVAIVESVFGERNDAVDWGAGAMKQVTNVEKVTDPAPSDGESEEDFVGRCVPILVEEGYEPEQAAAICYSKFKENSAVGGLKEDEEGEDMDKEAVLKALNSMAPAKQLTLSEVAEVMGAKEQLLTPEHVEALKLVNTLKKEGISDPLSVVRELTELREKSKADEKVVRNSKLDAKYGPKGTDGKNLIRAYAEQQVGDAVGEELDKRINALKDDPIAQRLAAEKMDAHSRENHLGGAESDGDGTSASGRRTDEV